MFLSSGGSTVATPINAAVGIGEIKVLQANLGNNLSSATMVAGNANTVYDTVGTGDWKFYVAGGNSIASITSASNSTEWTGGSLLTYDSGSPVVSNYSLFYAFSSDKVSGTTVYDSVTNYAGTLINGATIAVDANSRIAGQGYLKLNPAALQYMSIPSFTPAANGISFSFWFYLNGNPEWGRMFDFSSGGSGIDNIFCATRHGYVKCGIHGTPVGNISPDIFVMPSNNVWCHLVWTIASDGRWIVYLNGTSVYNVVNYYPSAGTRSSYCYFGNSMYSEYYSGGVDNFRYYDYVLSPSNVTSIYNSGDNDPLPPSIKDSTTGVKWISTPAIVLNYTDTLYTVKSNEIALTPGTNSTYAVWTSPKTTNIKVDVSFADYNSRNVGVGFQMFKINNDNTFGTTIFPRTVTSTALTNAAPTNYLSVPSRSLSVATGDKIYLRVDANGNTTAASSVLATKIYVDNNSITQLSATNVNEVKLLQAQLATNLSSATMVAGNANTVYDTVGTGDWKFYVGPSTSTSAITSASSSTEWTGGSLLSYIDDYYVMYYNFDTTLVSGSTVYNTASKTYDATLGNATVVATSPSPSVFGTDRGYLVCTAANYLQINGTYRTGLTGTSIATWINVNGAGGDIFNSSDGVQSFIHLFVSGGNSIRLTISNSAGDGLFTTTLYTNAAVNNGSWHHVVLIMTPVFTVSTPFTNSSGNSGLAGGVARWQLFFDGVSVFDDTWGNINAKYPDYIVRGTNKIGPITALIDDFRVYDMALTTGEIAVLNSRFTMWYKF